MTYSDEVQRILTNLVIKSNYTVADALRDILALKDQRDDPAL